MVADDLRASGQRRSRGYIVEAANESRGTDQAVIGQRRPLPRSVSLDEGEDFPTPLIDPQQPRRFLEPNGLQKVEEVMDKRGEGADRAPNCGIDAHDTRGNPSSFKENLFA